MFARQRPEVLVVGAGPVGLFAALSLAKRGVRVEIVDRDWRTGAHSYALALHGQSLQLLSELGLADAVLDGAYRVDTVGLYDASGRRAEIQLSALGGPFPFLAVMPQDWLERTLEKALREQGIAVQWNHEVARLEPRDEHVAVTINRLEKQSAGYAVAHTEWAIAGTTELTVPLVIGADGHRSTVRRSLGIEFPEVAPSQHFAVFEFQTDADFAHQMRLGLGEQTADVAWPLPDGVCRWSFELPDFLVPAATRKKQRVTVQQIGGADFPVIARERLRGLLAERAPWFNGSVDEVYWHIAVRFERRLAQRFGNGRVWLAGDAAHTTGPAGMQSMNVGFREAWELAQTVPAALQSGQPAVALESYGHQWAATWRQLLGVEGGLTAENDADPGIARHCPRLLSCIPASQEELERLAGQIGLKFASEAE